jgi:hypothetical protein
MSSVTFNSEKGPESKAFTNTFECTRPVQSRANHCRAEQIIAELKKKLRIRLSVFNVCVFFCVSLLSALPTWGCSRAYHPYPFQAFVAFTIPNTVLLCLTFYFDPHGGGLSYAHSAPRPRLIAFPRALSCPLFILLFSPVA